MTGHQIERHLREICQQGLLIGESIDAVNFYLEYKGPHRNTFLFGAVQMFMSRCMVVSRLIFPHPPHMEKGKKKEGEALERVKWIHERGKLIREVVGPIAENTSPLGDASRDVRNRYEHFDEYLDDFIFDVDRKLRKPLLVDMNLAPAGSILVDGATYLRNLDPSTGELQIFERGVSLEAMHEEVIRVVGLAQAWLDERSAQGDAKPMG